MLDIAAASWIRGAAFTPGARSDNKLIRRAVGPSVVAYALIFGIATSLEAARGHLHINRDRTVCVSIRTPGGTARSVLVVVAAIAILVVAAAIHLAIGLLIYAGIVYATGTRALGTFTSLIWIVAPLAPIAWRNLTLHINIKAPTLRQSGDVDVDGFAKSTSLPSPPPGSGPSIPVQQLVAWLPKGTPAHGIAFEGLITTYRAVATQRGTTFNERVIGKAWTIRNRTLRPNLHEVRF